MKKLSFLFVALAFVGFLSLNGCKSSTQPASSESENVEEAAPAVEEAAPVVDSAAATMEMDSTAAEATEAVEE